MADPTFLGIKLFCSIVISREVEKSPCCIVLLLVVSSVARTEILRLRLRMTMRAGRKASNAGSFLRKELGEALRNIDSF